MHSTLWYIHASAAHCFNKQGAFSGIRIFLRKDIKKSRGKTVPRRKFSSRLKHLKMNLMAVKMMMKMSVQRYFKLKYAHILVLQHSSLFAGTGRTWPLNAWKGAFEEVCWNRKNGERCSWTQYMDHAGRGDE
jgi:hypothetical protein